MRVIFFGTSEFAVPSLEQLVAGHQSVVMCVTQPDRRQGRGLEVEPSPVKRAAIRLGLPLMQPSRLQAALFETLHPDVGVVVAYGQLIRRDVLALPRHGMVGVPPSLLPAYRGAAPVAWALLNGDTTTGVTIFRLNERLDAGEMLLQERVAIAPDEHAQQLTERLAHLGAQVLLRTLEGLAAGRATAAAQDESRVSMAPKLTKTQGHIDWQLSAETIARLIRATIPWPGAATEWKGAPLKIWSASVAQAVDSVREQAVPGTVLHVDADTVIVAAGQGAVVLKEVQLANRRRMPLKEFLIGHKMSVGDILGGGT